MILTHMSAQMLRRARETGYEIAEDGETVEGVPLLVGGEGAALKIISRDLLLSHRFFSS